MLCSSAPCNKLQLAFDAIFYYVSDIEEAMAFYRDTLGLPMVSHDYVARFDLDGVLVELVPKPPGSVVPGGGNARLCFAVADLNQTLEHLHACGIPTSAIKTRNDGKIAFFRDPDGNELSLWQFQNVGGPGEIVKSAELHM